LLAKLAYLYGNTSNWIFVSILILGLRAEDWVRWVLVDYCLENSKGLVGFSFDFLIEDGVWKIWLIVFLVIVYLECNLSCAGHKSSFW